MLPTLYPLAALAQIQDTPSREDGVPAGLEEDLRAYGCKLIHQAGILLKQYILSVLLLELSSDFATGNRLQSPPHKYSSRGSGMSVL